MNRSDFIYLRTTYTDVNMGNFFLIRKLLVCITFTSSHRKRQDKHKDEKYPTYSVKRTI